MTRILKLLLWSCLVGVSFARTEVEIKEWFMTLGVECAKDYPITPDEMMSMHQHKPPTTENGKCLMACVYRKATWMDSKGMFDINTANDMINKEHPDDPKKLENSKKLFDLCKKVNEEKVSDGEKGCERAVLLSLCLTENATKFGFIIPV